MRPFEVPEEARLLVEHLASGGGKTPDGRTRAQQPVRVEKKVGRNDPCPCGSGKKYKKCCLH